MNEHKLKTWPEPFRAVRHGEKRYEIRKNDRGFEVGDVLALQEYTPRPQNNRCTACGAMMQRYEDYEECRHAGCGGLVREVPGAGYTGREVRAQVTYMTSGGSWGLPADLCVMSIKLLATHPTGADQ